MPLVFYFAFADPPSQFGALARKENERTAHHSVKPLKLSINIDFDGASPAQRQRKILSRLQPHPPSSIPPATMREWRTPLEAGFCVVHTFQEFRNVEDCSA
jgi:hypothetical protein